MCQSWLLQFSGVRAPSFSILLELQTGGGGVGIDSATEDVTSESVPHSGIERDGGKVEHLPGGGDVDLGLVVGGD